MKAEALFLVTRSDLPPGAQAAQAAHALREFVDRHPDKDAEWHETSNTLVLLTVSSEPELETLLDHAQDLRISCSWFYEPDLENALTAIALEPGEKSIRLCRNLPLLGKSGDLNL